MTQASDLTGLFKESYGDNVLNLIPESSIITKSTPFVAKDDRNGNLYHQPVVVQAENGVTYSAPNAGAFSLNSAITMKMADAQVSPYQLMLRATLDYESAARSMNGKTAFMEATELQIENMFDSIGKRLEICLLYGQTDVGTADTSVNTNATTTVLQLTTASWADGIWSGSEGATVSLFKTTNGDLLNTNGSLSISIVDTVNKKLTIVGIAADITAIDAWLAVGGQDAAINFYSSRATANAYSETPGIKAAITNTGTLWNVSASTYDLWKGNTYSSGSAALTFAKLQAAVATAVGRGLMEDVDVLVNPKTWANLLNDTGGVSVRMLDSSYSPKENQIGSEGLTYWSQNGKMTIRSHIFCKEGEAFIVPFERVKRLGSTDVTFQTPGRPGEIFLQQPNNAGFEYRLYSGQSLLVETPAKTVYISAIVNS